MKSFAIKLQGLDMLIHPDPTELHYLLLIKKYRVAQKVNQYQII